MPTKISAEKACSVVNPRAANRKWLRRTKVRSYLQKNLPGPVQDDLADKETTIRKVRDLCADRDLIIAIGGDGTVADVIQGILESGREKDVRLGIVPLGSGNAFRKALKIPKNLKKAVEILTNGEARDIDIIEVEGKAAGFVSVGATAEITHQVKLEQKIQGLLGHLLAARSLLKIKRQEREVELFEGIDEKGVPFSRKKFTLKFLDCVVAKTNYFGYSWRVAPFARVDDGYLDIAFFEIGFPKYLLLFPLIYFGIYQRRLKRYKAKRVILRGQGLYVQYNGEVLGKMDKVELKVIPRALKVLAPKSS